MTQGLAGKRKDAAGPVNKPLRSSSDGVQKVSNSTSWVIDTKMESRRGSGTDTTTAVPWQCETKTATTHKLGQSYSKGSWKPIRKVFKCNSLTWKSNKCPASMVGYHTSYHMEVHLPHRAAHDALEAGYALATQTTPIYSYHILTRMTNLKGLNQTKHRYVPNEFELIFPC